MTQEQYEYKLKSIDVRLSELENELDTVITIMKSNEKYDKDIMRQLLKDIRTNIQQVKEEYREVVKQSRNLQ